MTRSRARVHLAKCGAAHGREHGAHRLMPRRGVATSSKCRGRAIDRATTSIAQETEAHAVLPADGDEEQRSP